MAVTIRIAVTVVLAALAACGSPERSPAQSSPATDDGTTTVRRPGLQGLALREGLNLIDRTPGGVGLVARVAGDQITEWQVFDPVGRVSFAQKKDDGGDLSYCQVCELSGGSCSEPPGEKRCCWANWGCQRCDAKEQECRMECETEECKKKNSQPGTRGNAPDDGDIATLVPDGSTTFFDAGTRQWSMTRATGEQLHIPLAAASGGGCSVCTGGAGATTCWVVPCLPVKVSAYRPAPR